MGNFVIFNLQFKTTILPNSTKTLQYIMYPLLAGSLPIPKLVLSDSGGNNTDENVFVLDQLQLNSLTKRTLPSHIYVMVRYIKKFVFLYILGFFQPQTRGNAKLSEMFTPRRITTAF